MKTTKCFRFVKENLTSESGNAKWEIGKWNKYKGEIKLCSSGFHASITPLNSLNNIYGERWFTAEARGKIIKGDDKIVASEMRILKELPLKKICVEFALGCAKRCLKNYEKKYPDDKRPAEAIKAAEDYMDGKIKLDELNDKVSAAWSAARSAESAAWSAARSAGSAAWSAARSAWSAAWSAGSAARSAELKWQDKKLNEIVRRYFKR
jgi:hypothetical protein